MNRINQIAMGFYLLLYGVIYVGFNNFDQNQFVLDSIVLALAGIAMLFKFKFWRFILYGGIVFFVLSPFDLYDNITINKFQYVLNSGDRLFNHNRLLPVTYTLFAAICLGFIYGCIHKIRMQFKP